jgi:hypothetical protein
MQTSIIEPMMERQADQEARYTRGVPSLWSRNRQRREESESGKGRKGGPERGREGEKDVFDINNCLRTAFIPTFSRSLFARFALNLHTHHIYTYISPGKKKDIAIKG